MKMRKIWVLLLPVLCFLGCAEEGMDAPNLQGSFTGTFERVVDGTSLGQAGVSLVLDGDTFSGSGGPNRYPVICRGNFTLEGNTINFINNCFFTADFDWTLILSGSFEVRQTGNELVLVKRRGSIVDTYRLRKGG